MSLAPYTRLLCSSNYSRLSCCTATYPSVRTLNSHPKHHFLTPVLSGFHFPHSSKIDPPFPISDPSMMDMTKTSKIPHKVYLKGQKWHALPYCPILHSLLKHMSTIWHQESLLSHSLSWLACIVRPTSAAEVLSTQPPLCKSSLPIPLQPSVKEHHSYHILQPFVRDV